LKQFKRRFEVFTILTYLRASIRAFVKITAQQHGGKPSSTNNNHRLVILVY